MATTRVLFICTHNSARSQMAEGMLRAWGGEGYEVASAGTTPTAVRPEAVRVMLEEYGIDISGHRSSSLASVLDMPWDEVVTVCDQAREACPVFPGAASMRHWSFDDPTAVDDPSARDAAFRRVAREIAEAVRAFIGRPAAR